MLQTYRRRRTANAGGTVALFAGCSPRALKRLSGLGTRLHMPAGRQLTTAGSSGAEVLIVLDGTATGSVRGVEVASFGPGDFFGEVATLDGGPHTASVVASTDMDVLVLNRAEFDTLVKSSPEVAHRILRAMAHRLRRANTQVVA
jgi:CRP/FNR family transcriptional regulator, cyclic AMP receptor protein